MNYMLCRNRVRNFDQWKRVFDSHADAHRAAGLKLVHLWQEMDSVRNVFFLFEVEDIARARAFVESPDAAGSVRESGLIEGDFRFFGKSLGYGDSGEEEKSAYPEVSETVAPAEAEKSATPVEEMKNPTPTEPVKTNEPVKHSAPPETMKGPERVKSVPPMEPVEGWEPVENWPPAEAAAEATPQPSHHRGRWVRSKY